LGPYFIKREKLKNSFMRKEKNSITLNGKPMTAVRSSFGEAQDQFRYWHSYLSLLQHPLKSASSSGQVPLPQVVDFAGKLTLNMY
jgi:hypothetical protein